MDPLADKLLVTAALIALVQKDLAPAWMVAVILGREFAVTVLRSIVHARGQALPASPVGKIKMAAQVVAILLLILGPRHMAEFFVLGQIALWIATVAALVSAVDYWRKANAALGGKPPAERADAIAEPVVPEPSPRAGSTQGVPARRGNRVNA
jgi:CDP-diacylglycerol--glycerol-3-phosphate 3-phosphatidyltransferase